MIKIQLCLKLPAAFLDYSFNHILQVLATGTALIKKKNTSSEQRLERDCTVYACVVFIHSVLRAVHQGVQQSIGHIADVLALTWSEDDGEVDHHAPRGEACDLNSHVA